jgi:hypothetical protein
MSDHSDRFDKLEAKIDDIKDKLVQLAETNYKAISELKIVAVENTISLDEHMKRSDALERSNNLLQKSIEDRSETLQTQIEPLKQFVDRAKFLGIVIGTLAATLVTLQQLGITHFFGK